MARGLGIGVVVATCLIAGVALGAAPRDGLFAKSTGAQPWAQGVSDNSQRQANTLYTEGLALMKRASFASAADQFHKALAFWDHPVIQYNLAKTYMNLGQSGRALEHFWAAMRHRGEPLEVTELELVARYSRLIYAQDVAHVVVRLGERDAVVELDGVVVLDRPGTWQGAVPAGAHTFVSKKRGSEVGRVRENLPAGHRVEVVATPAPGGRIALTASRRSATEADIKELQLALVKYEVRWPSLVVTPPSEIHLPPRYEAICKGATGDLAYVCSEYERLFKATELQKFEAAKRLEALTRGGVVEKLQ